MTHKTLIAAAVVLTSSMLAGCVTPQANPQITTFTSTPPGAEVVYGGKVLGVTPVTHAIRDDFGLFSRYEFTAKKPGFADQAVSFREQTFFHAQGSLPTEVHFDLKPTK